MSADNKLASFLAWIGLLIAPLAWAANTQLGQILPYLDCQHQARFSAMVSFAGAAAASVAGIVSWHSAGQERRGEPALSHNFTLTFAGSVSALSAGIFVFTLSMQGLASLVLNGCER
jgi:hypothetical protein